MTKEQWEKGGVIAGSVIPAKPVLFSIELWFKVYYNEHGQPENELQRWYIHNQCWVELRGLRETIFTHGFFLERSPGRGEIIFPRDFIKMLVDTQPKGFKEIINS